MFTKQKREESIHTFPADCSVNASLYFCLLGTSTLYCTRCRCVPLRYGANCTDLPRISAYTRPIDNDFPKRRVNYGPGRTYTGVCKQIKQLLSVNMTAMNYFFWLLSALAERCFSGDFFFHASAVILTIKSGEKKMEQHIVDMYCSTTTTTTPHRSTKMLEILWCISYTFLLICA